jgi:hypothetical protein
MNATMQRGTLAADLSLSARFSDLDQWADLAQPDLLPLQIWYALLM